MALDLSATATRLLRNLAATSESGFLVRRRIIGGSYDPINGDTPGTTEDTGLNGAALKSAKGLLPDSRIIADAQPVVIDNKVKVLHDDTVLVGGVEKTVLQVDTINHAGTVQVYIIQVSI